MQALHASYERPTSQPPVKLNRERRYLALVLWVSVIARVLYFGRWDVRFRAEPLVNYLQFLDPELLRHRLAESIFYLRDQPPLFNLALGIVLKLFPVNYSTAFAVIYASCGLLLATTLYSLMVRMRISPPLSALVTVIFVDGPITSLYENWLFYTFPLALVVCASTLFLHRYLESRSFRDASIFFFLVATLVLARGIFHPFWMLPLVVLLIAIERGNRRRVAQAALLPCLLVAAFTVKNQLVFHTLFTGRPLQKMALGSMTTQRLPLPLIQKLIKEKKLSPLSLMSYASGLGAFRPYIPKPRPTGVPVLDLELKSTGFSNWNHSSYVDVGELYGRDLDYTIEHYPEVYIAGMRENVMRHLLPSDQSDPFNARSNLNRRALARGLRAYDYLFAGQWTENGPPWFHWIGFPALLLFALCVAVRGVIRRRFLAAPVPSNERATELIALYCFYNILTVSVVTIALSYGDHNRYRFKVSALYCVLLALAIQWTWNAAGRTAATSSAERLSAGYPPRTVYDPCVDSPAAD